MPVSLWLEETEMKVWKFTRQLPELVMHKLHRPLSIQIEDKVKLMYTAQSFGILTCSRYILPENQCD